MWSASFRPPRWADQIRAGGARFECGPSTDGLPLFPLCGTSSQAVWTQSVAKRVRHEQARCMKAAASRRTPKRLRRLGMTRKLGFRLDCQGKHRWFTFRSRVAQRWAHFALLCGSSSKLVGVADLAFGGLRSPEGAPQNALAPLPQCPTTPYGNRRPHKSGIYARRCCGSFLFHACPSSCTAIHLRT